MLFHFFKTERIKKTMQLFSDQRGYAAIITVIFLLSLMLIVTAGFSSLALSQIKITRTAVDGKQSYFLAEAGVEDIAYRLRTLRDVSTEEVLSLGGGVATTTITDVGENKEMSVVSDVSDHIRKVDMTLAIGDQVQFFYSMQIGTGGLIMENNSSVGGNIYSSGTIVGNGGNLVKGEVISAGPNGYVEDVRATSSIRANTIVDAFSEGDAYYQTITNTTVLGTSYPDSEDVATTSLPITDEMITSWEEDAEEGGVISSPCPYDIDEDVTLGPVKITCDIDITGSPTVTLAGTVWVTGNIYMGNSATILVDASLAGKSVAMIADDPNDRLIGSHIDIGQTVSFVGDPSSGSYIMLLSQNESAEQGGSEVAILAANSINGDLLLYANHGEIQIRNRVEVQEVTGYLVRLQQNAEVIYRTGLASVLFDSGPSGGYEIFSWREAP